MRCSSSTSILLVLFALSAPALAQSSGSGTGTAPPSDTTPGAKPGTPTPTGDAPVGAGPSEATGKAPAGSPSPPSTGSPPGAGGLSAPAAPIDRGALLPSSGTPTAAPAAPPASTPPAEARSPERRTDASTVPGPKDIYAEDWWVHSRPIFELHGYLRVRAELLHGFSLGRLDSPSNALWPQPPDNSYVPLPTQQSGTSGSHSLAFYCHGTTPLCYDKSQAGANIRFRVNPELHISDNLRIVSQIDMLDNLVLGSTPAGYVGGPDPKGNPSTTPYIPVGAFANTQIPPTAGSNSFTNSIAVKRAWAEYATPVGQLRFGRMPSHWGLGILENSGDGYDSDWQSTVDRIMFTTGLKSLELYVTGAWDFPNEGPTSATAASANGGQAYDLAQLDDVNQYVLMIAHRRDPELVRGDLARGDVVLNGGVYFAYRDQMISATSIGGLNPSLGTTEYTNTAVQSFYIRRDLQQFTPDLWIQLLYRKFRFETEAVMIAGSIGNLQGVGGTNVRSTFRQFGVATQTELKAVEDRLRLQFGFGWASGDAGLVPAQGRTSSLSPANTGDSIYGARVLGDNAYREFRFHPDYRVDLILNRNILGRVQGEYYFRPSADYDFSRSAQGQRLGGGAAVIWSRTSEFVQAPGHSQDLGIEFDLSLYYQSKDGALNDDPDKMGGFFTMLQYGVLFPLGGLGYLPYEIPAGATAETSAAHTVRWYLGVLF